MEENRSNTHGRQNFTALIWAWALLALLSSVVPYGLCRFGLDMTDSPYHLINAQDFGRFAPTVLSYWLIGTWTSLTDPSMLETRYFSVFLLQIAGLAAIVPLRAPIHRKAAVFACFNVFISTRYCTALGYDEVSTLFLTLTCAAMLRAIASPRHGPFWAGAAGVAAAGATLARLPNCLAVGVCVFVLLILYRKRHGALGLKSLAIPGIHVAVYLLSTFSILAAIYGGLGRAQHAFTDGLSGLNSSYGLYNMIENYAVHAILLVKWLALALLALTVSRIITRFRPRALVQPLFVLVCSLTLFASLLLAISPYYPDLGFLLFGVMLSQMHDVILPEWKTGHRITEALVFATTIVLFCVVPAAGSNTGLLKFAAFLYLPVTTAVYWPKLSREVRLVTISAVGAAILCIPAQRLMAQYEEAPIQRTTVQINHPRLKGIFTTPSRKRLVEDIVADAQGRDNPILFAGKLRHVFEYLDDGRRDYSLSFWSDLDDPAYVQELRAEIRNRSAASVYVVPSYETMPMASTNNLLESMLGSNGYVLGRSAPLFRRYDHPSQGSAASGSGQ